MQELNKLRWRCRRGCKELDLLLLNYLEQRYPLADSKEQQTFQQLLDWEDRDLQGLMLKRDMPSDPHLAQLILRIFGSV